MPRYDYKCEANGHVFEVTQGFNDEPVAYCPEDGSKGERQLSVPHVIYKGSGFYTTDYKNNGNSSSSSSSASKGSDSGSDSKAKSESTSIAKSESKSSSKAPSSSSSKD